MAQSYVHIPFNMPSPSPVMNFGLVGWDEIKQEEKQKMNLEVGQIWQHGSSYVRLVKFKRNVKIVRWISLMDPKNTWYRGFGGATYISEFELRNWTQHTSNNCITCGRFNACRLLEVECAGCRYV